MSLPELRGIAVRCGTLHVLSKLHWCRIRRRICKPTANLHSTSTGKASPSLQCHWVQGCFDPFGGWGKRILRTHTSHTSEHDKAPVTQNKNPFRARTRSCRICSSESSPAPDSLGPKHELNGHRLCLLFEVRDLRRLPNELWKSDGLRCTISGGVH